MKIDLRKQFLRSTLAALASICLPTCAKKELPHEGRFDVIVESQISRIHALWLTVITATQGDYDAIKVFEIIKTQVEIDLGHIPTDIIIATWIFEPSAIRASCAPPISDPLQPAVPPWLICEYTHLSSGKTRVVVASSSGVVELPLQTVTKAKRQKGIKGPIVLQPEIIR